MFFFVQFSDKFFSSHYLISSNELFSLQSRVCWSYQLIIRPAVSLIRLDSHFCGFRKVHLLDKISGRCYSIVKSNSCINSPHMFTMLFLRRGWLLIFSSALCFVIGSNFHTLTRTQAFYYPIYIDKIPLFCNCVSCFGEIELFTCPLNSIQFAIDVLH